MEEITRAAKAIYEKLPAKDKEEIVKMFNSMDQNEDKKISLQEFNTFFVSKGDQAKANSNLFNLIDQNGDKTLTFEEALTLSFIIGSGGPFCDGCGKFIQALFFTAKDGYKVCVACYETGNFKHRDHTEFLDNYTLFAEMEKKNREESAGTQTNGSLSPDGTMGTNQQKTRKRDMFKKGFKAIKEFVTTSALGAGVTATVTAAVGANESQEETY